MKAVRYEGLRKVSVSDYPKPKLVSPTEPLPTSIVKLPGKPGDEWEDDFVLLADVFPNQLPCNGAGCGEPRKNRGRFWGWSGWTACRL